MMKSSKILIFITTLLVSMGAMAAIDPKATWDDKGTERTDWAKISGEAPLLVHFAANATLLSDGESIEWHIRNQHTGLNVTRYDEAFDFTFNDAGDNIVAIYVRQGNDVTAADSITVAIDDSALDMPNAFTPNNDGYNERYQAKKTSKSIVEFHAYIFNRYGQKLYEWTDWDNEDGGWDGTYNGSPVKDGVYFVYVKARGSDGREYNIRRDVNLIRDHNNMDGVSNEQ